MQTFSIFVSSPEDVDDERKRAERVIRRLQMQFDRYIRLEPIFWEHKTQSAQRPVQEPLGKLPAETDLVVCILWSRLGTRLPDDRLRRPDGTPYLSATEFEFESALEGRRAAGAPDLWIYRKTAEVLAPLSDPARKADTERRKTLLDDFFKRWLSGSEDHFKAGFTTYPEAEHFELLFARRLEAVLRERCPEIQKDADESPSWAFDESPYRGLAFFGLKHAPVFHGRQAAVQAVLSQLRTQAGVGRPFVLVFGAGGAGKSSLLRAGLLHALVEERRMEGVDHWRHAIFRPAEAEGSDLLIGLAATLLGNTALPELADAGFSEPPALARVLAKHPAGLIGPLGKALNLAAQGLREARGWNFKPVVRLVLVVDPLEEIFRGETAARDGLLAVLQALAASGIVWTLAAMNREFYPEAAEHPVLSALKVGAGQYDLPSPDRTELGDMIRCPARAAGLYFEIRDGRSLDALLLESAAAHSTALPLLEFTLDTLCRRARERGETVMSFADFEAVGGLEGAVARAAEAAIESLDEAAVREVFRQLLDLGGGRALRRRVPRARFDADPIQKQAVDRLIAARLLVSGDEWVEAAHEALPRFWKRLAGWIAEDTELLALSVRLEELAVRWRESGRDVGHLLQPGKREQDAILLLQQPWMRLGEEPKQFLTLSLQRIRRGRRLRGLAAAAGVAAFLVLASGLGWTHYLEQQTTELVRRFVQPNGEAKAPNPAQRGESRQAPGDSLGAAENHRPSQVAAERSVARDSAEVDRQRNLAAGHNKVGDTLSGQGDLPGALASYRAGLAIAERLAAQDPASAEGQADLASVHGKLGLLLRQMKRPAEALDEFRKAAAILEPLSARTPDAIQWLQSLAEDKAQIAEIEAEGGKRPAGRRAR